MTKRDMSKVPTRYRARGKYDLSNRESWVTTVWRETKQEAEQDARAWGNRYTGLRVVSKKKWSLKKSW